jgi:hypothetical protein
VLGTLLQSRILVALCPVYAGLWLIVLTWIATTDEDTAFELRSVRRKFRRSTGAGWPFALFPRKLTYAEHHQDFERLKWLKRTIQYPLGVIFVGVGIRSLVKALGLSGVVWFW